MIIEHIHPVYQSQQEQKEVIQSTLLEWNQKNILNNKKPAYQTCQEKKGMSFGRNLR